ACAPGPPWLVLFELETGGEGCFGDLNLLRRGLGRGHAVLQLVSRPRECTCKALLGVAHHPAEDLRGRRQGHELCAEPRGRAHVRRSTRRDRVAERGRRKQRSEQV